MLITGLCVSYTLTDIFSVTVINNLFNYKQIIIINLITFIRPMLWLQYSASPFNRGVTCCVTVQLYNVLFTYAIFTIF